MSKLTKLTMFAIIKKERGTTKNKTFYISTLYVNIYYATGECNFDPSV